METPAGKAANHKMTDEPKTPFQVLSRRQRLLLSGLGREGVRFVVVGGYAVRAHGHLRPVEDLDVFVERTEENITRLRAVLAPLGAERLDHLVRHLSRSKAKVKWHDVEFFSSMNGLEFENVQAAAVQHRVDGVDVPVMSRSHLILAKRMAERARDRDEKAELDRRDIRALTGDG